MTEPDDSISQPPQGNPDASGIAPVPGTPAPGAPAPETPYAGQLYPPPPSFPPPPGTQYGNTQYSGPPPGYSNAPYGNYGPYNNGPYGYPLGYYPPPLGTSGMAIASLVLGICGFFCVTPFVGLGLGIGALSKIAKTGQPGKGLAIAGIILSIAWIALIALTVVAGEFSWHFGSGSGSDPNTGPTQGPNGTSA